MFDVPSTRAVPADDLLDAVVQLSFAVQAALARIAAAHDLSLVQLRLLGILRDRKPEMRDLARHLGLDKSSITGLVDRAERRGFVVRSPAPRDGRAIQVALTAAGRRVATTIETRAAHEVGLILDPLTARDRTRLTTLLGHVLQSA